jgi:hypothetical protein
LFRTLPLSELAPRDTADASASRGAQAEPESVCLSLRATRGTEAAWNDREASKQHRVVPLKASPPFSRMPMVSALVRQLKMPKVALSPTALRPELECRPFDVF